MEPATHSPGLQTLKDHARLHQGSQERSHQSPASPTSSLTISCTWFTHQDLLKGVVPQASVSRGVKDHREGFVRGLDVAKLHLVLREEERSTAGLLRGFQES